MVRKGIYITTIVAAVLLLAASVGIGVAAYHSQQNKVRDMNMQIASLQNQVKTYTNKGVSQPQTQSQQPQPQSTAYTSPKGVKVIVYAPERGATVTSPVAVVGEVPGNWSFEAQFPILVKDSSGKVVAHATAQVLGNWMTSDLVPFSAQLTYQGSPSGSGTLVLQKDNPSQLPANDDSVSVPIEF